jgi:hypothetical protein
MCFGLKIKYFGCLLIVIINQQTQVGIINYSCKSCKYNKRFEHIHIKGLGRDNTIFQRMFDNARDYCLELGNFIQN